MNHQASLVTILINNYNYGRFLGHAIDSALGQTYRNIEVVVVDDGSTDESRAVIHAYGTQVVSVFKRNGGQASALNEGIRASRGEFICFLDSDDCFDPEKVERVVPHCESNSMVYHRLRLFPNGGIIPLDIALPLDAYRYGRNYRFVPYLASPTSGLTIGRDLALRLFPLPTEHARSSADDFVVRGALLIGQLKGIPDVLASYRVHGENAWHGKQQLKSHAFMDDLEKYLNRKLIESGREPVIDFYHSMYARDHIAQRPADLAFLALTVFRHHPDIVTTRFLIKTLARAVARGISPMCEKSISPLL